MFARSTCQMLRLQIGNRATAITRSKNSLVLKQAHITLLCRQSASRQGGQTNNTLWNKIFGKYLLATNIASSGVLMIIGDVLAQEINYSPGSEDPRYNVERILRMFIVGALLGPIHHYGYIWMERLLPLVNARSIVKKIFLDQVIMGPICLGIFFYSACYFEGKSLCETNREIIAKFPFIYLMDWLVWPAAQYINFRYLHIKYRVIYVNIVTALYNIFLSYAKHELDT